MPVPAVGVGAVPVLIQAMLAVARLIVQLAESAQRNREKCALLKDHVGMITLLLEELQRQWTPDPVTSSLLKNLDGALNDGKALVESCQQKRTLSRIFKTQKKARKFDALDVRISRTLEQFHVANMILIVGINKERFFINVLQMLLRNDACRLLSQEEKQELLSSIKSFTNMDNMSSDAKEVLQRILRDLTARDNNAATTSYPNASAGDDEVVRLALSIVQEATALKQNREEIEQLVQFVQQIANLMQQPQSWWLSRHPETRPMVSILKSHLRDAYKIVLHNQQHSRNSSRIPQAYPYGGAEGRYTWQQPDLILKVAYKIEYYVQILPVYTMRQIKV